MSNVVYTSSVFDPHKFSTSEIFSNNNGKTSSTKVVGFLASIVCLVLFIMFAIYYLINPAECQNILLFVDKTITYFTVSAGLMGVKSVTSAFGKLRIEITGGSITHTVQDTNTQQQLAEE